MCWRVWVLVVLGVSGTCVVTCDVRGVSCTTMLWLSIYAGGAGKILGAVKEARAAGKKVLVHCWGGA